MPRKNAKKMRGDKIIRVRREPLARSIRDALDPEKASGKPKTLAEMTPAEKAAILAKYRRT